MTPRLDVHEVRAALRTTEVLQFFGWDFKKSGDEYESAACPARSDHSRRRAFVINQRSGRWRCFPCATSGDLFHFIGEVDHLDSFRDILTKAASIAGVESSDVSEEERRARNSEWKRRAHEQEIRDQQATVERDLNAVDIASHYWSKLKQSDDRGQSYLAKRYVDEVTEIDSCIRFDPNWEGSPSVPLFNSRGEIWNVVARRLPELGEPKTRGLKDCPTKGTLLNPVTAIEPGKDVVVAEGVIDSLTARLAMHETTILGAHGADNISKIVKIAAPIVKQKGSRLLIVPHQDEAGFKAARLACSIALDAGLSITKGTLAIVCHPENDLNDAWRSGWRAA